MNEMEPFLKQVAEHACETGGIDGTCFVFPNRRAMVFFRKYLCAVAARRKTPLLVPEMLTINDFFYRIADADLTDRVTLLLTLYDCYKALHPKAEPLDDFIFWGDVILADFSDVDKYLVDPRGLFANVAELRDLQDTYTYLTDEQRSAIEHFITHFREGGKLKVRLDTDAPDVKARFLQIWNLLYPLYTAFTERLRSRHQAYDGMVYRAMAERLEQESAVDILAAAFPNAEHFVFIGLNALSTSEKRVLKKMKDAALTDFCWDYSSPMIRDGHNRSSVFMEENIALLGQSFQADSAGLPQTEFHVVSVPSATGQARLLPALLGDGSEERTAIVLPDESLLQPVLACIPPHIQDINVTMGAPMSGSALAAFMSDVAALQLRMRRQGDRWLFYHKNVWSLFSSQLLRQALEETEMAQLAAIKRDAQYYIPAERFDGGALLQLIFRPVVTDPKAADAAQIRALEDYQTAVLSALAPRIKAVFPQEVEYARRYFQCIARLRTQDLAVQPQTYVRLLNQLLAGESVPYNGEPVKGLQIMGPLETRALDFDTLIILSCNEGVFPRRSVSSSFVPPELRKGFGMPTYEYQDAVWAYYFYRMIQRAQQVWLLYDSRTEKMKPGEESRYIKQLEYHFRVPVQRHVARAAIASPEAEESFPKPAYYTERLHARPLSASALQSWLACPAQFFYGFIEGLEAEEEVAESLDAGMIGNVYHKTMQALYTHTDAMRPDFDMARIRDLTPMAWVTDDYLSAWLKRRDEIHSRVLSLIQAEMNTLEVTGRNLVYGDVILNYVLKTLERDRERLRQSHTDRFRILGLEECRFWSFDGFRFKGYIDRLDSFTEGEIRVVDYKTGKVTNEDVLITDANAEKVLDALFGTDNAKRPKIALQLFLYDMYVSDGDAGRLAGMRNAIYPAAKLFTAPPPEAPVSPAFCRGMKERLSDLLKDLSDPTSPITRTADRKTCDYCDFKNICGR